MISRKITITAQAAILPQGMLRRCRGAGRSASVRGALSGRCMVVVIALSSQSRSDWPARLIQYCAKVITMRITSSATDSAEA